VAILSIKTEIIIPGGNQERDNMKVQLHSGYTISANVHGIDEEVLLEITYICSECGSEHFSFSEDVKKLYCEKCKANIGYRLGKEWKRPQESHSRKFLSFVMDGGIEFVWTCSCGHDLHLLMDNSSYAYCEKCERKTAKRKNVMAATTNGKVSWKI